MDIILKPFTAFFNHFTVLGDFVREHSYLIVTVSGILCLWVMIVGMYLFYLRMKHAAMFGEYLENAALCFLNRKLAYERMGELGARSLEAGGVGAAAAVKPKPTSDGFLCYLVTCKQVNDNFSTPIGTIIEEGVMAKDDESAMDAAVKALWEGRGTKVEVLGVRVVEGI